MTDTMLLHSSTLLMLPAAVAASAGQSRMGHQLFASVRSVLLRGLQLWHTVMQDYDAMHSNQSIALVRQRTTTLQ
jgi:hypothetical protein